MNAQQSHRVVKVCEDVGIVACGVAVIVLLVAMSGLLPTAAAVPAVGAALVSAVAFTVGVWAAGDP